jgi:hypothetical protein
LEDEGKISNDCPRNAGTRLLSVADRGASGLFYVNDQEAIEEIVQEIIRASPK